MPKTSGLRELEGFNNSTSFHNACTFDWYAFIIARCYFVGKFVARLENQQCSLSASQDTEGTQITPYIRTTTFSGGLNDLMIALFNTSIRRMNQANPDIHPSRLNFLDLLGCCI